MRRRNVQSSTQEPAVVNQAADFLKKVDVYPKLQEEYLVKTQTGAKVSIITGIVMVVLFLSELRLYLTPVVSESMVVDTSVGEKLRINLNVSFLSIDCANAHISAMDVSGDLQIGMHQAVKKIRLDSKGQPITKAGSSENKANHGADYCGSCHGARHPDNLKCCNTCEQVKEAFMAVGWPLDKADATEQCTEEKSSAERDAKQGEGCQLAGFILVNRVAGNFHVALGQTFHREDRLVHQFKPGDQFTYNASHIIHSLSFGTPYSGMSNSLDGLSQRAEKVGTVYQYFVKIVPTIIDKGNGEVVRSYQHSYTRQVRHLDVYGRMTMLPGTFFIFDFSAFMMQIETKTVPFTHFLTKVCAIIGGGVSLAGFIDSVLYHYVKARGGPISTGK